MAKAMHRLILMRHAQAEASAPSGGDEARPLSAAGRAEGGMATEMLRRSRVVREGEAYQLPVSTHWQTVILRRAALRRAFREGASAASLHALGLDAADLAAIDVPGCPNDIAFVERAHARLEARDGPAAECGLDEAVAAVEALAAFLKRETAA